MALLTALATCFDDAASTSAVVMCLCICTFKGGFSVAVSQEALRGNATVGSRPPFSDSDGNLLFRNGLAGNDNARRRREGISKNGPAALAKRSFSTRTRSVAFSHNALSENATFGSSPEFSVFDGGAFFGAL